MQSRFSKNVIPYQALNETNEWDNFFFYIHNILLGKNYVREMCNREEKSRKNSAPKKMLSKKITR